MTKLALNPVASGYNLARISSNFARIQEEFQSRLLYRDNPTGEPNMMEQELDMNGFPIINAGTISASGLRINGVDVEAGEAVAAATRQVFEFTATDGQTTFDISPLEPTVSNLEMSVNGWDLRNSSLSITGSLITFPALEEGDEVAIRVFTREVGASPTANEVVFTSSYSGASASTVAAALENGFINVKTMFGAIGNGIVDDTAAIQAAIDAADGATTGHTIFLPAGIYKISAALDVGDKQNLIIRGEGINLTVIRPTTSVTKAIIFGTGSGTAYQGIFDILIDCSSATSCIGVEVNFCDSFWYDRVVITGASIGLNIVGGVSQFYTNFRINLSKVAAIKMNGGNDHFFNNGLCSNAGSTQPSTAGLWVVKSDAFWVDNIDFISQKVGILIAPQGTDYVSWVFISQVACDTGSGDGIRIEPASTALVKGVHISNSWSASNDEYGVYLSGVGTIDGVRLNGHRSFRNKKSGYYAVKSTGNVKNFAFVSSEASGNSWTNSGVYSGFDIAAGISEFSIIGCRSGQMAALDNTQARGILVNPGASDNYIIALNDTRGNVSAGILDSGTGSVKQVGMNIGA